MYSINVINIKDLPKESLPSHITLVQGDILQDDAEALVNPVNCVGVMGKGLAEQFKKQYPFNYSCYVAACVDDPANKNRLVPGKLYTCQEKGKKIINFPTKQHWKDPSKLSYIKTGLLALVDYITNSDITSIAIPALGCGEGGLVWEKVKPLIVEALTPITDLDVRIYPPQEQELVTTQIEYIGRKNKTYGVEKSPLSNPFTLKKEEERKNVLAKYQHWLEEELNDPMGNVSEEIDRLASLLEKNKILNLGCFCSPKKCHAESIGNIIISRLRQKLEQSTPSQNELQDLQFSLTYISTKKEKKPRTKSYKYETEDELWEVYNPVAAEGCKRCDLRSQCQHVVWSRGKGKADLMIIGEAPGENEDKYALPFVGNSGKMLEIMLNSIGLTSQEDCWIVNALKCRPPLNRNPQASEVKACFGYLVRQILEYEPRLIVCVGNYSATLLTGNPKYKVTTCHGKLYPLDLKEFSNLREGLPPIPVIGTFHPAYLLCNPDKRVASPKYYAWMDWIKIRSVLDSKLGLDNG